MRLPCVRAGQARLRPPGVGCGLRLRRGILRRRRIGENAPCAGGRCSHFDAAGIERARARPPGRGRSDPSVDGCRNGTRLHPSRYVGQSQSHRIFERPCAGPARLRQSRDCHRRRSEPGARPRSRGRPRCDGPLRIDNKTVRCGDVAGSPGLARRRSCRAVSIRDLIGARSRRPSRTSRTVCSHSVSAVESTGVTAAVRSMIKRTVSTPRASAAASPTSSLWRRRE